MKENNEKKIKNEDEISILIKAFPKDIAAVTGDLNKRLARLNTRYNCKCNRTNLKISIELPLKN